MSLALLVSLLVFVVLIGGMINLLKDAKNTKIPQNYDKSKTGFDDEEDDW